MDDWNVMDELNRSAAWDGVLSFNNKTKKIMVMKPIPKDRTSAAFKPHALTGADLLWATVWFGRKGFVGLSVKTIFKGMMNKVVCWGEDEDAWKALEDELFAANWPRNWR